MRPLRFERMRPAEIVAERERCPLAYLPIGPLEWHGPHLPLGTDPLHAEHVAVRAAEQTGGVVLPTLYAGSASIVPAHGRAHTLGAMGLPEDARVVGMDFPANSMRSLYFDDSVFALTVREFVRSLDHNEYRVIALVNGHAAGLHVAALQRVAAEESRPPELTVLYHGTWSPPQPERPPGGGHAARGETEAMLALEPDTVDLATLPAAGTPITYPDYGIVDGPGFAGNPPEDFAVAPEADPRAATAAGGAETIGHEVAALVHVATEALANRL